MPDRADLIESHIPGLRRFARALLRGDADRLLWVMPLINLLAIAGLAGWGSYSQPTYSSTPTTTPTTTSR